MISIEEKKLHAKEAAATLYHKYVRNDLKYELSEQNDPFDHEEALAASSSLRTSI